jgi:hypothetical protein
MSYYDHLMKKYNAGFTISPEESDEIRRSIEAEVNTPKTPPQQRPAIASPPALTVPTSAEAPTLDQSSAGDILASEFPEDPGDIAYKVAAPALAMGLQRTGQAMGGLVRQAGDYTNIDMLAKAGGKMADYYGDRLKKTEEEYSLPEHSVASNIRSGLVSMVQMLGPMGLGAMKAAKAIKGGADVAKAAATGARWSLAPMAAMTEGEAYDKYRDLGHGELASTAGGMAEGAIEYYTEKLHMVPFMKYLSDTGKTGIKALIEMSAKAGLGDQIGEQLATLGQSLTEKIMAKPDSSLAERKQAAEDYFTVVGQDGLTEFQRNAKDTFISTLTMNAATGGLGALGKAIMPKAPKDVDLLSDKSPAQPPTDTVEQGERDAIAEELRRVQREGVNTGFAGSEPVTGPVTPSDEKGALDAWFLSRQDEDQPQQYLTPEEEALRSDMVNARYAPKEGPGYENMVPPALGPMPGMPQGTADPFGQPRAAATPYPTRNLQQPQQFEPIGYNRMTADTDSLGDSTQSLARPEEVDGETNIPTNFAERSGFDPSSMQGAIDASVGGPKFLGDILKTDTHVGEGYAALDIPTRSAVLKAVLSSIDDDKVFRAVIPTIPVEVVNDLVGQKLSAKDILHNKSMFIDALSTNNDLAVTGRAVDAIVRSPAIPIAEIPLEDQAGALNYGGSTAKTSNGNSQSDPPLDNDNKIVAGNQTNWKKNSPYLVEVPREDVTPEELTASNIGHDVNTNGDIIVMKGDGKHRAHKAKDGTWRVNSDPKTVTVDGLTMREAMEELVTMRGERQEETPTPKVEPEKVEPEKKPEPVKEESKEAPPVKEEVAGPEEDEFDRIWREEEEKRQSKKLEEKPANTPSGPKKKEPVTHILGVKLEMREPRVYTGLVDGVKVYYLAGLKNGDAKGKYQVDTWTEGPGGRIEKDYVDYYDKAEAEAAIRKEVEARTRITSPSGAVKTVARTPDEALKSAKANAEKVFQEGKAAIIGILKNATNPNKLSSGLTFDDETYQQIKPHLSNMWTAAKDATADSAEALRGFIQRVMDEIGAAVGIDAIKPFARKFYEDVKAGTVTEEKAEKERKAQPDTIGDIAEIENHIPQLAERILDKLRAGENFSGKLTQLAASWYGVKKSEILTGNRAKVLQEAAELAVVQRSREIVADKNLDTDAKFEAVKNLYSIQPILAERTSTSMQNQAYSTPAPIAFAMQEWLGLVEDPSMLTYEPTAGTGMLVYAVNPKRVSANEIGKDRLSALREQGIGTVTQGDGRTHIANEGLEGSFQRVVANPPFGKADPVTVEGFPLAKIEHQIMVDALSGMADDGKAAFIIGGHNFKDGQMSSTDRVFLNWLYSRYNVTHNIDVNGDVYSKQGTKFPIRVITIDGRKAVADNNYAPKKDVEGAYQSADTVDALRAILKGEANESVTSTDDSVREVPGSTPGVSGVGPGRDSGSDNRVVNRDERTAPEDGEGSEQPGREPDRDVREVGPGKKEVPVDGRGGSGRNDAGRVGGKPGGLEQKVKEELQVPYTPTSKGPSGFTLVPKNSAEGLRAALERIAEATGNIDEFVRSELQYESTEKLFEAFSAEQIDALAMSLYNMKNGKGMIIGDMTGIGKGRVVAGIIRHTLLSGKTPIFMTEKPKLFSDMWRDLVDIGTDNDVKPLVMASDSDGDIVDAWGNVLVKHDGSSKKGKLLYRQIVADGKDALSGAGRNTVFVTYSQFNLSGIQRDVLATLAPDSVIILDEAHNAGGKDATPTLKNPDKVSTAQFIRSDEVLGAASGVIYSSATFAKRPDNLPLYFRTALGSAGMSVTQLIEVMKRGGVALQQFVSAHLTKAGDMIRREQDFSKIARFERKVAEDDKARVYERSDTITEQLRGMLEFSEGMKSNFPWDEVATENGQEVVASEDGSNVASVDFNSGIHNLIAQIQLSLKADAVVDEALTAIKEGFKPVVGLMNTMGSFLADYAAQSGLKKGDAADFTFNDVLVKMLNNALRYEVADERGNKTKHYATEEQLERHAPDLYEEYLRIKKVLQGLNLKDMPASPIDYIKQKLSEAGHTAQEITGRTMVIAQNEAGVNVLDSRTDTDRNAAVNGFNNGGIDALIINRAGATGLSLHPTARTGDKRPRRMIIAQADLNIDTFVQMLGRIFRKGQIHDPEYIMLSTALPSETRPAIVVERKMQSMNANTSANDKGGFSSDIPDMINQYGDEVVAGWLRNNPAFASALGVNPEGQYAHGDLFKRASGRMGLMAAADQEAFWLEVVDGYKSLIAEKDALGQNDLVVKDYDFKAITKKKTVIHQGTDESNPFTASAVVEEVSVINQGKPYTTEELTQKIAAALGSKSLQEFKTDLINSASEKARAYLDQHQKTIDAINEKNPERKEDGTFKDVKLQRSMTAALTAQEAVRANFATFRRLVQTVDLGKGYALKIGDDETIFGVPYDIRVDSGTTGNPLAPSKIRVMYAIPNGQKTLPVGMARQEVWYTADVGRSFVLDRDWADIATVETRTTRHIITGNVLQGFNALNSRAQLVNFTREDGTRDQGILVPITANIDKLLSLETADANKAADFLEGFDNRGVRDSGNDITVLRMGDRAVIRMPGSKAKAGKFFLDQTLVGITGDFRKSSGSMVATVPMTNVRQALTRLEELGARYMIERVEEQPQAGRGSSVLLDNMGLQQAYEAIRDSKTAQAAYDYLRDLAAHFYASGKKTFEEVKAALKEFLGDLYKKVGILAKKAYDDAVRIVGNERGSISLDPLKKLTSEEQRQVLTDHAHSVLDRVRKFIDNPGGLGNLPDIKGYLVARYRVLGTLSEIKDFSRKIFDTFKRASEADAKAIYGYLTTKDATTDAIQDVNLRDAAEKAKRMIEEIGDKLVAYKLLPKEVMDKNRGEYLPRVYLRHIIGDEGFKALGSGKKADLDYAKKRKNLPEEQRIAYGEIKDPAYLLARGFSIPNRDMVILDWLAEIASRSEWTLPKQFVEWAWSGNVIKKYGNVQYSVNEDGTYNVRVDDVKVITTKHRSVSADNVENFLGSKKLADFVKAGKGKTVLRPDDVDGKKVFKPTPWKKIGHIQYRVNSDGTFNFRIKEKVRNTTENHNVSEADLGKYLSEAKKDAVLQNHGRIINGQKVSPFWLKSEADRIRKTEHATEDERRQALQTAARMDTLADAALEEAGVSGDNVPKGFRRIPDTAKYGALRGMAVRKEIHNDLVGSIRMSIGDQSWAEKLLSDGGLLWKAMRWFKFSKVAANVPSQVRNFVSNAVLLNISGVRMDKVPLRVIQAMREISTNGKHWKIAKKYGVKEATFSNTELAAIQSELVELEALHSQGKLSIASVKLAMSKLVNALGSTYQFSETLFKTAKIIDEMEKGMNAQDAALEAHKWLFDYSLVGANTRYLRNSPLGFPFLTFTMKVLPRLLEVMFSRKVVHLLPYVALAYALPQIVAAMLNVDDDEIEELKQAFPEWIAKKNSVYILPWKDSSGRWQAIDISYFFPWAQWMEAAKLAVVDRDIEGVMRSLGLAGSPVGDIYTALKTNIDPFTQRPIVDKHGMPREKAAQILGYAWGLAVPTMLTDKGFVGKGLASAFGITNRRTGDAPPNIAQVIGSLTGANIYAYHPEATRERNIDLMLRDDTDRHRTIVSRLRRDKNMSDEKREELQDFDLERHEKVAKRVEEYVKASDSSLLEKD